MKKDDHIIKFCSLIIKWEEGEYFYGTQRSKLCFQRFK